MVLHADMYFSIDLEKNQLFFSKKRILFFTLSKIGIKHKFKGKKRGRYVKSKRTDLALEATELLQEGSQTLSDTDGVCIKEQEQDGLRCTVVEITSPQGAKALGKVMGRYVTLTVEDLSQVGLSNSVGAVAAQLRPFLEHLPQEEPVLVVGLGNRFITPDAIGPEVHRNIFVTRHLRLQLPEIFGGVRSVASVSAEVLGNTGIESGEVVRGVCRCIHPCCIIAVDALACRSIHRLCSTIQISNTGITPGSGVGNHRFTLNEASLGVPVIALGVPTVVDAATLCADLTGTHTPTPHFPELMVTPRDIDQKVAQLSKLIAYGINLALQPEMTVEELELLLH